MVERRNRRNAAAEAREWSHEMELKLVRWIVASPIALASAAVLGGCAVLLLLGAPLRMPLMNLSALLIGLCAVKAAASVRNLKASSAATDIALVTAGLAIPLTAMFGEQMDGVARWLVIAGITLQPALMVIPPLVVGFAIFPSPFRALAVALASAGVAMQPDPAAAAMLALGIALALLGMRRSPLAVVALAASCAGLSIALAYSVALPAVPFAEGLLLLAVQSGAGTTTVALAAVALVFVPAVAGLRAEPRAALAFVGVWLAGLGAALLGPYPTPIVGFGGSAVIGYVLSVAMMGRARAAATDSGPALAHEAGETPDNGFRFA